MSGCGFKEKITAVKDELPENHRLSEIVLADPRFLPAEGGNVSLTDIQYEALAAGVARGKSLLIVSATSTGKTLIAVWSIAAALERNCNAVYLVTHRALAHQKFDELQQLLVDSHLAGMREGIVVATGDGVFNGNGETPSDLLSVPVLVATYEKYLAMLSVGGPRRDMSGTAFVCDEIQLIGDKTRGQNVEILMTLIKRAGWAQFVGLSAVLREDDARKLADWLEVQLLRNTRREKTLHYECRTNTGVFAIDTNAPEDAEPIGAPAVPSRDTLEIVRGFVGEDERCPIIVFCMRVQDTYDLAARYFNSLGGGGPIARPDLFGGILETTASGLLARYIPAGVAFHNADLTEEERRVVEDSLEDSSVKVVFATSTLAAGVNFPLATAVFDRWKRWDFNKSQHLPIEASEFHNMAGRVGRMGSDENIGHIVFVAEGPMDVSRAKRYLNLSDLTEIEPRISHSQFERLLLQLLSAELCASTDEVFEFLASTMSGVQELNTNRAGLDHWRNAIQEAAENLRTMGYVA